MAVTKQFTQLDPINNGTTAADNFKLSDAIPAQHTDLTGGVNKLVHRTLAQSLCEPVAVCNSNNPQNGAYTATCQNYPDFALSYQDAQQNTQYLIGLKIRVIFTYGITYGSVSGGTYPTLNINGSGAIPMLAQGKTMASGAASAGQSIEFTIIPYGNGVAFDADSNVRESTSDYTIYTDGKKQDKNYTYLNIADYITLEEGFTLDAESWLARKDNRIKGMLIINCDGTWSADNEINICTLDNSIKSNSMIRGLYAFCGEYKYRNRANLYCATSANTRIRMGLYNNTSLSATYKKIIVIELDYITP